MGLKVPKEIAQSTVQMGVSKTWVDWNKNFLLGFLAGAYIGLGGLVALRIGGALPPEWGSINRFIFGAVFPLGLILVVLGGADLFTGGCLTQPMALYRKEITWGGLIKNWIIAYSGNLLGALFVAYFIGHLTGLILEQTKVGALVTKMPWASFTVKMANAKSSLPFGVAFWRGVGCNWLVCLAIWLTVAAEDVTGKIIGLWFPIMGFVAIGFEHSVANMFFVPLGIMTGLAPSYQSFVQSSQGIAAGAPALSATWGSFVWNNLLPVTLGNIVAGAVLVAAIYWYVYLKE